MVGADAWWGEQRIALPYPNGVNMDAIEFFSALYEPVRPNTGVIELRLLKNGEPQCVRRVFSSTKPIIRNLIELWTSVPGAPTGVYYGVAMRKPGSTSGRKTDISVIPALWTDIDTGKMGWSDDLTIGALKSLDIRPSAIVHSGNGLHAYWALKDPVYLIEEGSGRELNIRRVESAMRLLANVVGGDRTFDITRVLRVPGTFNTKGDKPKPVKVMFAAWEEYSLEQIEELTKRPDTLLDKGKWLSKDEIKQRNEELKKQRAVLGLAGGFATDAGLPTNRLSWDMLWQLAKYGGGDRGSAFIGLDEAMTRGLAIQYANFPGTPHEVLVERVVARVRDIKQRDAPLEGFDEAMERRKAHDKLNRFADKWQARREAETHGKRRR